eukprot:symbB.v1.2.026157.t1/scaffold2591.1/size75417/7
MKRDRPRHLRVGLKGNPPFLNEDIFSLVETDSSFWMIEDGELHIQLQKVHKGETWHAALKGHGQLDMFSEQEVNKKLMLERFQELMFFPFGSGLEQPLKHEEGGKGTTIFPMNFPMQHLLLEILKEEHPGFDFSGASFSGQAPSARSFMGGIHADPQSLR